MSISIRLISARRPLALAAALFATASGGARAASPAASSCPTGYFLSGQLAQNESFEVAGPDGPSTCWSSGGPDPAPSAADGWFMHSSNSQATVCSRLEPTTAPGPSGHNMLHFRAGSLEGGVYQVLDVPPDKTYMFSVWVYVVRGQVVVQSQAGVYGPHSWSTKRGEWEQLRVCTNSLAATDWLVVYNQDPRGGEFYVDRAEVREIPTIE